MAKYLTVAQYRLVDAGIITPEVTDLTLLNVIQNAEADIDSFMEFGIQHGGFELHRVWTQSAWDEKTLRTRIPTFPIPAQAIYGYKIQVSNLSGAGAGCFATIGAGDCVINVFEGYVEIVHLQAVTYALSPVILQLGLKPPLVQMEYLAGFYLPVFGETLYNSGNNILYYAQRGFWATTYTESLATQPLQLPPIPPVVYVNGTVTSSSNYTLNTTEGTVTFNSSQGAAIISCDYTYTIPDNVKQATINRTTWLLGQRLLNQMGFSGLEVARTGEQTVRRSLLHPLFQDLIDPHTANKLM